MRALEPRSLPRRARDAPANECCHPGARASQLAATSAYTRGWRDASSQDAHRTSPRSLPRRASDAAAERERTMRALEPSLRALAAGPRRVSPSRALARRGEPACAPAGERPSACSHRGTRKRAASGARTVRSPRPGIGQLGAAQASPSGQARGHSPPGSNDGWPGTPKRLPRASPQVVHTLVHDLIYVDNPVTFPRDKT